MSIITNTAPASGGTPITGTGKGRPLPIVAAPTDGVAQVSTLTLASATSGEGTLTVGDYGDVAVTYDEDAAGLNTLIEALDPNGILAVTITGLGTDASPWEITVDEPTGPVAFAWDNGDLDQTGVLAEDTPGVAATYQNIVAAGGLLYDHTNDDVYENTGTINAPAFGKIDA